MDRRIILADIIKNNFSTPATSGYFYPDISDKIYYKVAKFFDKEIIKTNIVAFFDFSFFKTGKAGIVFTLAGIYLLQDKNVVYFNYTDIKELNIICDENGFTNSLATSLSVSFINGNIFNIGKSLFYKDKLKNVLLLLKNQVSDWGSTEEFMF